MALSFLTGRREVLQEIYSPQPFGNETPLLSTGREMKGLTPQWLGSCRSQAMDISRAVILSTLLFIIPAFLFTQVSVLYLASWAHSALYASLFSAINSYFLKNLY